ncbi:MAG: heparan-alpha-glucosaminide N-acetyltransferase domain-containing protein [Anaerolineae bacterium]
MQSTPPNRGSRLVSIDALRGMALLFMVIDHSFDWWLAEAYRGGMADQLTEFIGTLAAPIFVSLVGVGVAISVGRAKVRQPNGAILWRGFRRGMFFILLGYGLNFIVFFAGSNWNDVFAVDVLHLIGLGVFLGTLVAQFASWWACMALAVIWMVGSALFGGQLVLPPALGAWVNGLSSTGYFPVLPWLAFIWFGLGTGKLILLAGMRRAMDGPYVRSDWLALVGAGFFALFLIVPNGGFRHPRLAFVCLSLAILFLLWAGFQRLATVSCLTRRFIVAPMAVIGQVAFMLYVLHHLLGYRLMMAAGLVTGRSWQGQYGALTPEQCLILLFLLLAVCWTGAYGWIRIRHDVQVQTLGRIPGFRDFASS